MNLEQSFEVQAPIDVVWEALNDLEQIAPCLPGAAIEGQDDDGTYKGTFGVKLGPTTASYRGTIKFTDVDKANYVATMVGKGTDKRGSGGASATIVNTLTEIDGGTRVDAVTDFTITGKLARFGRGGMIKDISNRLLGDFATCLQAHLQSAGDNAASAAAAAEQTPAGTEAPTDAASSSASEEPAETAGGAAAGSAALAGSPGASSAAPTDSTPVESSAATTSTDAPAAGTAAESPATPAASAPAAAEPAPKPKPAPARPAAAPPASKPISATALLWSVIKDRIARLLGRGK